MIFSQHQGQGYYYHGSAVDPYLSNVVFLVNGVGTTGATIRDSLGHSLSVFGNTSIVRTDSDFPDGGISMDGTGDYIQTSQSASEFVFPGDFTLELDYKAFASQVSLYPCPFSLYNAYAANGGMSIFDRHSSTPTKLTVAVNGSYPTPQSSSTAVDNTLYRIMFSRSGSTMRLFINGILEGSSTFSGTVQQVGGLWLGTAGDTITSYKGILGRIRVTKGIARATANYTPTTRPYPTY